MVTKVRCKPIYAECKKCYYYQQASEMEHGCPKHHKIEYERIEYPN